MLINMDQVLPFNDIYTLVISHANQVEETHKKCHANLYVHVQVSNAYLQSVLGSAAKILFEFVKEMPKPETRLRLDFSSLLGPLFFTWIIVQLFPVSQTKVFFLSEQCTACFIISRRKHMPTVVTLSQLCLYVFFRLY